MIVEIPTSDEFHKSANDLLHAAWDQITSLLIQFDAIGGFEYDDTDTDTTDRDRYWMAAKQTIITSYAMIQQGVEFYIKARIANISGFLLISGNPASWPKRCDKDDVNFSMFRTVDAQDLIKLHDTVCADRFDDQFREWYEKMRSARNKIMHTVDRRLSVSPEDVLEAILYTHQYFCGEKEWIDSRFSYLDGTPENSIRYIREHDAHKPHVMLDVHTEIGIAVKNLPPAKVRGFFGYEKRTRGYNCPVCYEVLSHCDFFEPGTADDYFKPFQLGADNTYNCSICSYSGTMSGEVCFEDDCDSRLVDSATKMCVVCGAS